MPRRRKRNASLMIRKKKQRYTKLGTTIDSAINIVNEENNIINNNDDVTISDSNTSNNMSCISSNIDLNNIVSSNDVATNVATNVTTIKAVSDDDGDEQANSDEVPVVVSDFNLELKLYRQMKVESHRWSVFNLFLFKYDGLNPPEQADLYQYWTGRCGVASKIKKDLDLPRTYCVKERMLPIFERILECFKVGERFHPSSVDGRGGNRPMTIRMDSHEAQIIADGIESGLSLVRVWQNVNRHRSENNDDLVSQSSIYYALRKMRPKMVNIKKRKQGSSEPESNWAQARYAWTRQLLARFGKLKERHPQHGPIERRFDGDLQGKLSLHQVVWWDETHRKCLIGGQNPSKTFQILFPRNENGDLDIENGEYSKERKTVLNVKYEKECCLGLGVAMVTPLSQDGTPLPQVGRRCHPFDYTSKVMISIDDYERLKKIEFQRVKALNGRNGYWVSSSRDDTIPYYNDDPVSLLKGVGKKTAQLLQEMGLRTIGQLKEIDNPSRIDNLPNGLSTKKLTNCCNESKKASQENAQKSVDHRAASYPYQSKFGNNWEMHLQSSPTFSNSAYMSIYRAHYDQKC